MSDAHVKLAKRTDLRQALAIGLDEALVALEESIADLTDDQMSALPIPNKNNIAWIVISPFKVPEAER